LSPGWLVFTWKTCAGEAGVEAGAGNGRVAVGPTRSRRLLRSDRLLVLPAVSRFSPLDGQPACPRNPNEGTFVSSDPESGRRPNVPPQENLKVATERGFDALAGQRREQFLWLGAAATSDGWQLPVLDDALEVDLSSRRVTTRDGNDVGPAWRILVLHYLAIDSRPERLPPEVTFAGLPTARSYAGVYHGRVISRLCATAGREARRLSAAAKSLGGKPAGGGDAAFDFDVFPRVTLRLIWHAPDDEFPPSATLLLPANIESYFCSEDIVVLSECLVARLGGRSF
jgi:hypothetical protein